MKIQPGVGYTFDSSDKGFTLDTSDPFPDPDGSGNDCPLTTYNIRKDDDTYKVNITSGMVNNLVVKSDDGVLLTNDPPPDIEVFSSGVSTGTTLNYVYIRCGNSAASGATPAYYPARSGEGYPSIRVSADADKVDDNDYSWILIAIVKAVKAADPGSDPVTYTETYSITKMIGCNSLWTERFKCGTNTAIYWWSAV
jgi:hypothetical protein